MKTIILIGSMLLLAVFCGCASVFPPAATATETFTYDIDEIGSSDDEIDSEEIDLFENEDYVDHRENIISVDQVSFVGTVINNTGSDVQFILFADAEEDSNYTTFEEIAAYGTRVFTIPNMIPAGSTPVEIDWDDAVGWMEDPDFLADLIINDGRFRVYAVSDVSPYEITADLTVIITVSVSL